MLGLIQEWTWPNQGRKKDSIKLIGSRDGSILGPSKSISSFSSPLSSKLMRAGGGNGRQYVCILMEKIVKTARKKRRRYTFVLCS